MCSFAFPPSGHQPGPAQSAHGPAALVGPTRPEPDRPDGCPTAAAGTALLRAVANWLATGAPTSADLAAWTRVFRALEEQEWPDFRLALGPGPSPVGGEGGGA